ncbi:hypothetical protein D9M72_636180 [compost metagenome]
MPRNRSMNSPRRSALLEIDLAASSSNVKRSPFSFSIVTDANVSALRRFCATRRRTASLLA